MSLGISLICPTSEPTDPVWTGSPTYNLGPMWRAAGADLSAFGGKTGAECLSVLTVAIERMEADPATFKAMNPANGWGDYDGLLAVFHDLRAKCETRPDAVFVLSP